MQRGTLTGSPPTGISGTPVRELDWTLDATGNWPAYLTKTSGTTDLNQTRTANTVNEITAIGGTPAWYTPPVYDAAGNMTTMPQVTDPTQSFTAVYDAWNRMVQVNSGGSAVATYQYDGRNRRIGKVTTSPSETRHVYFTNDWQDIEERTGSSSTADQQYVWGIRYVDELVCRDRTVSGGHERLYTMQDANFNLTGICNTSGAVVERYVFGPYGNRVIHSASWSPLSASAYAWDIGHQGLGHDDASRLLYDRNRMLHAHFGRFVRRDPSGYAHSGSSDLYEYISSRPVCATDPSGLASNNQPTPNGQPPEFQPGIPDPIPDGSQILLHLRDLDDSGYCGSVAVAGIGKCSANLTWTDLGGLGCGPLKFVYSLVAGKPDGSELCDKMIVPEVNRMADKGIRRYIDCAEPKRCCNKARFNGKYEIVLKINAVKGDCQISGAVVTTIDFVGEIGTCI